MAATAPQLFARASRLRTLTLSGFLGNIFSGTNSVGRGVPLLHGVPTGARDTSPLSLVSAGREGQSPRMPLLVSCPGGMGVAPRIRELGNNHLYRGGERYRG